MGAAVSVLGLAVEGAATAIAQWWTSLWGKPEKENPTVEEIRKRMEEEELKQRNKHISQALGGDRNESDKGEVGKVVIIGDNNVLIRKGNDKPHRTSSQVQPARWPTAEEVQKVEEDLQYHPEYFHLAVSGFSGSGKSSLINAFRGLEDHDQHAAGTGVVETTLKTGRFPDPNTDTPPRDRMVWYDIPGAGTIKIPGADYFISQGLFIFDFIIVLFDNRFTEVDAEIIRQCRRFDIPCFIVRSKADQHIDNEMKKKKKQLGRPSSSKEEDARRKRVRDEFVAKTRENVRSNLADSGLDADQKVYIISSEAIYSIVKGEEPEYGIDEKQLVRDLLMNVHDRRYTKPLIRRIYQGTVNVLSLSSLRRAQPDVDPATLGTEMQDGSDDSDFTVV